MQNHQLNAFIVYKPIIQGEFEEKMEKMEEKMEKIEEKMEELEELEEKMSTVKTVDAEPAQNREGHCHFQSSSGLMYR